MQQLFLATEGQISRSPTSTPRSGSRADGGISGWPTAAPNGTCLQRAIELAESIAALPQPALRTDIEAARRGQGRPLEDGLRVEAQAFNRSIVASETIDGLRQFNERDHPDRRTDTAPVTPGLARSV